MLEKQNEDMNSLNGNSFTAQDLRYTEKKAKEFQLDKTIVQEVPQESQCSNTSYGSTQEDRALKNGTARR